jgi:hypothetical protein
MDERAGTVAEKVPDDDTVNLESAQRQMNLGNDNRSTYELPVHEEADLVGPLITLQYVPAANDVLKVADHAESALLMATNPAEPRPNAIWLEDGEAQLVRDVPVTLFRNPTMPATPVQRCWQSHPFVPPLPEQVPTPAYMMSSTGEMQQRGGKRTVVGSPSVVAWDCVAREDSRSPIRMGKTEYHRICVLVVR